MQPPFSGTLIQGGTEERVRSRAKGKKNFKRYEKFYQKCILVRIIQGKREMMVPEKQEVPRQGWNPGHKGERLCWIECTRLDGGRGCVL